MDDRQTDFSNAIRCLRNMNCFREGTSFDDINAHFVIVKAVHFDGRAASLAGGAGKNRQDLWIQLRALEHFAIMANTQNSYMLREYFIDLKHIMTEYNMYLEVYKSKKQLCLKDSIINNMNKQKEDIEQVLTSIEDKVVLPALDSRIHELMVFMYSVTNDKYIVLRTQERNKKGAM